MTLPRRGRAVLAAIALLAAGCGKDEGVRSYTVPRATDREARPAGREYRILGAVYPADAPAWYFKFAGPADQVAAHEAAFDKLAGTVRLAADPSAVPAFDLPAGWTKTGPRTVSRGGVTTKIDETLRFGPADAPLEVTVTHVPGGGVAMNVGRWATQVGAEVDPADPTRGTRPIDAAGGKGLRVDLRGPQNPAGGMMGKPR